MQKTEIQPISVEKDKLTILIAEDNESNYRLFESILGHDYHLIHAWDGREAVERFKRENPQIILMDINMPVMDGYEATQEIRKYSAKVPIIAVTAFAYASDEQRVMENGFDGYMPKPINARQLKAQITEIMQKRIILLWQQRDIPPHYDSFTPYSPWCKPPQSVCDQLIPQGVEAIDIQWRNPEDGIHVGYTRDCRDWSASNTDIATWLILSKASNDLPEKYRFNITNRI